ncbi:MAG: HAMP domain-containing sensor histidine kinase [Campylobacterota bacterium]|nr:HAMP domain-containing sensor histidine kinase [Campylobacterota bacterium]
MHKNKKINKLTQQLSRLLKADDVQMKRSELKVLVKPFRKLLKEFRKILKINDQQQAELEETHQKLRNAYRELERYKNDLEVQVKDEIKKRKVQENLIFQQSKFAALGEMVDAIAHQWSQPLNSIGIHVQKLAYDYQDNNIDRPYIDNLIQNVNRQQRHMTDTLGTFRRFLSPSREIERFDLNTFIDEVLILLKDSLVQRQVMVIFKPTEPILIEGTKSELQHVLINLINNASEAYKDKKEKKKIITLTMKEKRTFVQINVKDRAGGIDEAIIHDIFKPYTSSKQHGNSGIGLYMSQKIIQKHGGDIEVSNVDEGARFTIKLHKRI